MKTSKINLSGNDKLTLISNLSTMLSAGIPILEAVDSISEGSKGNQKKILETLKDDLIQGQQVHVSFAKFPNVFDKVAINIIKASEEAGTLDTTLKDLRINIKKDMEFLDKVRSALMYPILIMVVFSLVLLMILIVVIPRISSVFSRLRVTLPLPTKIMIFVSNIMLQYTVHVVIGTIIFVTTIIILYKSKRRMFLRILSSLPLVSGLVRDIDITRFTRSFYLLLTAGIPITTALELTQNVVLKKDVSMAISHAKEVVYSGKKLSEAFRDEKKVIPTLMTKITEAGERSGTLDKSMEEISEHMDYEVSKNLQTLTTLLEPIMLIFVGILVGGMMLAIIAPIYGLIGQVGNR